MMNERAKPYLWGVWVAVVLQIGGRVVDGRWHTTHDAFEGASEQLRAHWLLWIGVIVALLAAGLEFAKLSAKERGRGLPTVLIGTIVYVPAATWHFIEHTRGVEPALAHPAHLLPAIGQTLIVIGAIWALVEWRRTRALRTTA